MSGSIGNNPPPYNYSSGSGSNLGGADEQRREREANQRLEESHQTAMKNQDLANGVKKTMGPITACGFYR